MRWSGCDSDDQFPEILTGEQAHKGLGCVRKAVNDVLAVPHLPGLDARGNIRKKDGECIRVIGDDEPLQGDPVG